MPRRRDSLRATAPKEWEKEGSSAARLYRRLVVAVEAAEGGVQELRSAGVPSDRLDEAAAALRSHATMLTAHLVVASRLPLAKRQRALLPYRGQVDDVEWLSAKIGTSAIEARGHGTVDAGLADIGERLTALQQGRAELAGEPVDKRRSLLQRRNPDEEPGVLPAPFQRGRRGRR